MIVHNEWVILLFIVCFACFQTHLHTVTAWYNNKYYIQHLILYELRMYLGNKN